MKITPQSLGGAIFRIGLVGDGGSAVTGMSFVASDLSNPTGFVPSSEVLELVVYASTDSILDANDQPVGGIVGEGFKLGTVFTVPIPQDTLSTRQTFLLATVFFSAQAVQGHAFKLGFPKGGVITTSGNVGSEVIPNDANHVEVGAPPLSETTQATGIHQIVSAAPGSEVPVFSIGLTGNNTASVAGLVLQLSDLSTPTGFAPNVDIDQVAVYESSDNVLDANDVLVGQLVGTYIQAGVQFALGLETNTLLGEKEVFYIATVKLAKTAGDQHAFKLDFPEHGLVTSVGYAGGSAVQSSDSDRVEIHVPQATLVAVNDSVETSEDTPITVPVLANDQDGGAPGLRIVSVGSPRNGSAVVDVDGTITYTPNRDFYGQDVFAYTIANGIDSTASATVSVQVLPVNDPPNTPKFPVFSGAENTSFKVDLLEFAQDPDNLPSELTWTVLGVSGVVASANIDGTLLVITPVQGISGQGSVQLSVTDIAGASAKGVLTIDFASSDVTPPRFVSGPIVEGITDHSGGVQLETDELTTVSATLSGGGLSNTIQTDLDVTHFVQFDGLAANTDYNVVVSISDAAGNTTVSSGLTFRTAAAPDTTAPVFEQRPQVAASQYSANLSFAVNEPATVVVHFGVGLAALTRTVTSSEIALRFSLSLPDLSANTVYYYALVITDLAGNQLTGSGKFQTLQFADTTPPVVVAGPAVQGIGENQATVGWKTDEPAFSQVVYDTLSLSESSPRTALTKALDFGHVHWLSGLSAGKSYFYQVVNIDAAGNQSVSKVGSFTTLRTLDTTPPVLTARPVASSIRFDQLVIAWKTDEVSTSEVVVVPLDTTVAKTASQVVYDLVQTHVVAIGGLVGGTTYRVSVRSVDAAKNALRLDNVLQVTTAKSPDTSPPKLVQLPAVQKVSDTQAYILWGTDELADGFVEVDTLATFGTSQTFGSSVLELSHGVVLTHLLGEHTYYYRVFSTDALGNGPTQFPADKPLTFRTLKEPDTSPPIILEGPVALSPSESGVVIRWGTDEPADTRVRFSVNEAGLSDVQSAYDPALVKDHAIFLTGLLPDTLYYYQAMSFDREKNGPTKSPLRTFRTRKSPDISPPRVIAGPSVVERTPTSALIVWETDEPATSEVVINGVRTGQSDLSQKHWVQVTDLTPETRYDLGIVSTDAAGNTTQKKWSPFTTLRSPDVTPPDVLEGPVVTYKSDRRVAVAWTTDEPATSKVTLWPQNDPGSALPPMNDDSYVRRHVISVPGLNKGTTYSFRIESSDPTGNTVVAGVLTGYVAKPGVVTKLAQPPGGQGSFTTDLDPDTQFPIILKGPSVVAATTNTLIIEWLTDENSDSGVDFGIGVLDEHTEEESHVLSHQMVLTNLDANTTYQYQVGSTDPAGNGATKSAIFLAKTAAAADTIAPRITVNPSVIYKTERQATIAWETDEGSPSSLSYGTTALDGQVSVPDFVTQHQVTVTNLNPTTTYQYRVQATDAAGNGPTFSQILTFTTDSEPDLVAPTITTPPSVNPITNVSAVVRWETDELSDSAVHYAPGDSLSVSALGFVAGAATDAFTHEVTLTHLTPGTTYSFLVQSIDRSNNGPVSSQILTFTTLTTKDETPPAVPGGLRVRGALGKLAVSWTPVADADVAGYDVLRAVGEGAFTVIATQVPTAAYVDDGLDANTTYSYEVRAVDQAGNQSGVSSSIAGKPDGSGLPSAPVLVGVEGDSLKPTLVVQNAVSSVALIYNFEVATDANFSQVVAQASGIAPGSGTNRTGATGWTLDVSLDKGVTYFWRAWAFDGVFDGPYMTPDSFEAGASAQLAHPGDFDNDLVVGFSDFLLFVGGFGSKTGDANYQAIFDFDGNGTVDFNDFISFVSVFGTQY